MTYNLPPGLKRTLFFYWNEPWLKLGHPIVLFEHLRKTYGTIVHYRFMGTSSIQCSNAWSDRSRRLAAPSIAPGASSSAR